MPRLRSNKKPALKGVVLLHFHAEVGDQRTETFEGREHLVIPVVALVEGVIQAANAEEPELALAEEFGKHVEGWNGRPVVVDHPQKRGQFVSANSPEMLEKEKTGTIFNARVTDKKLHLEAWVDLSLAEEKEDRISDTVDLLKEGDVIEVSTGIFVDIRPSTGRFNGEDYEGIWTNTTPDHLAILSGGKLGACSIEDGCGANRVNHLAVMESGGTCTCEEQIGKFGTSAPELILPKEKTMPKINEGGLLESGPGGSDDHTHMFNSFVSAQGVTEPGGDDEHTHTYDMTNLETEGGGDDAHTHSISNLRENEGRQNAIVRWLMKVFKKHEEISDVDKRAAIQMSLQDSVPDSFIWVAAVFSDFVVYETMEGLFRRAYEFSEDGVVTISEEFEAVRPETNFVPIKTNEEKSIMDKEAKVKALIANESTKFTEDSREFLEGLDEDQLDLLEPVVVEATPSTPKSEENGGSGLGSPEGEGDEEEPMTAEAYIAEAPEAVRDVLKAGMALQEEKRKHLVSGITANERNKFSEAELNEMDIGTLEKLAPLAKVENYSGKGAVPRISQEDNPNFIPMPESIFAKKGAA